MSRSDFTVQNSRVYRPRSSNCPACGERVDSLHSAVCQNCSHSLPRAEEELESPRDLATASKAGARLLHLSDLHVGPKEPDHLHRLSRWLLVAEEIDADVVVVSGDIVDKPNYREGLKSVHQALDDCGRAWAVVPGNHDCLHPKRSESPFYEVFGQYPRLARVPGLELLLLDSNCTEGLRRKKLDSAREWGFAKALKFGLLGAVTTEQMNEVEGRLGDAPAHSRVVVLHHHVQPMSRRTLKEKRNIAGNTMGPLTDAPEVRSWAARVGVRLILHGHMHDPHRTFDGAALIINGGTSTKDFCETHQLQACAMDVGSEAIIVDEIRLPLVH